MQTDSVATLSMKEEWREFLRERYGVVIPKRMTEGLFTSQLKLIMTMMKEADQRVGR